MMKFRVLAKRFRGIRTADVTFDGVCAIGGPNGGGKTTLLSVPEFLATAYRSGVSTAVDRSPGGAAALEHHGSDDAGPVQVELVVGDIRWELSIRTESGAIRLPAAEKLSQGDVVLFQRHLGARGGTVRGASLMTDEDPDRTFLAALTRRQPDGFAECAPMIAFLEGYRLYQNYHLWPLRKNGSQASADVALDVTAQNAFTVLRNWHSRREFRDRWDFVMAGMRAAFGTAVDDIDFDPGGQINAIRVYRTGVSTGLPGAALSNGILIGLLHLMAVASAPVGGVLGIDEPENGLHPHAVSALLEAIRERAASAELTVLLATHSPALMNAFRDCPDQLYFSLPAGGGVTSASQLRDPAWLSQFALGDLYLNEEVGAPAAEE